MMSGLLLRLCIFVFQIASQQMRLKQIVGGERLVVEWIGMLTSTIKA